MKEFNLANHSKKRNSRNARGRGPRRDSRGNKRDFNGRDSGEVTMHKVICDKCSKECEVPFKPSSDKPIYCDDCFKANRSMNESRSNGKSRDSSGQLKEINVKPDKILKLLE